MVSVGRDDNGRIVDFPDDWATCLYSGNTNGSVTQQYISKIDNIRVIDNTHASKFLTSSTFQDSLTTIMKNEIASGRLNSQNISSYLAGIQDTSQRANLLNIIYIIETHQDFDIDDLNDAAKSAARGYQFEPQKGAWAIISENFVENTSSNSEIIGLTSEANINRTWGQVEIPTALKTLPSEQKKFNTTVGELNAKLLNYQAMGDTADESMKKVLGELMSDLSKMTQDATVYYDSVGNLIYAELPDWKGQEKTDKS